jgi:hypothetical protein
MATPIVNFGKATVSTGYDAVATSIVVTTGHGSRFSSTFPYPAVWWNATDYADPADDPNREIVLVTAKSGDLFTVTRGQEGIGASTKNTTGKVYKMIQVPTAATLVELATFSPSQTFRGLLVQTSPDYTISAQAVRLVHADAIIMSDGREVLDWNDLEADITATGVGGKDTGAEQASTWYEIHAIYNPTSQTKALMLHRSKDYAFDEDISAGEDATQGLRSAVDNSTVRISQSFQVDIAGKLEFIDVKLDKTGSPTGQFWFTIESNNAGVPDNTPLATSDKLSSARLTATATWVRIPFRTPASISASTTYHIVMYGDYTVSATHFVGWRMDSTAAAYARGLKCLFDSDTSTWTQNSAHDQTCKVYMTENDTALTLPAGYTAYAKLGYVFNDAGSNFKPFRQSDRRIFYGYDSVYKIGAFTSTTPDLLSLAGFIPPVGGTIQLLGYNGSASHVAFGGLTTTDLTVTSTDERAGMIRQFIGATEAGTLGMLNVSEYQAMMYIVQVGTLNLYIGTFTW